MTFTVLRTAVGSAPALFVLSALKSIADVRVVAVDAHPLSFGFHFADASYVVPLGASPEFIPALVQICQDERVDLVMGAVNEEIDQLAHARAQLSELGVVVPVPDPAVVDICLDKYRTYQFFRQHNIPTPATFVPGDRGVWPDRSYIIKPRRGRGSTQVYKADHPDATAFFAAYVPDSIVQEYVAGTEYSIDTLSDLHGRFLYCAIRERIATESGISSKGRSVRNAAIAAYVQMIAEALPIVGPACIQCMVTPDGAIAFIEINLRIGGGAALSLAAGAPIVTDLVRLARNQPIQGISDYREGRTMVRYWSELFLD